MATEPLQGDYFLALRHCCRVITSRLLFSTKTPGVSGNYLIKG